MFYHKCSDTLKATRREEVIHVGIDEERDEEFRSFFDATSQCSGATFHEIGQLVQRRKLWSKDKIRKFISWFILEGLQEEWLVDEMEG